MEKKKIYQIKYKIINFDENRKKKKVENWKENEPKEGRKSRGFSPWNESKPRLAQGSR